ncbi:hypothetical protein XENOCAPTIV_013710, partial [Xenoophorus captivus]
MRILRRLDAYALDHTGSRGVVDGTDIQPLSSSSWRLHRVVNCPLQARNAVIRLIKVAARI